MTTLTFEQFIHPLSEFPQVENLAGTDEPTLDFYTMAGVILYTACVHDNQKARKKSLGNISYECRIGRCKFAI